jgi:hypothetical protein
VRYERIVGLYNDKSVSKSRDLCMGSGTSRGDFAVLRLILSHDNLGENGAVSFRKPLYRLKWITNPVTVTESATEKTE